jgi:CO/xanthine dehydrogenase Mo-binding subunit
LNRPAPDRRDLTDARIVTPPAGPATTEIPVVLPPAAPEQAPLPTLGRARPAPLRREGPDKLTGAARYTDDLVFPGAWYGGTIRSSQAHARLLGIELDPGFDWSRVVVMTAADIPGENIVSSIKSDMPALAADLIRHHAEPVALVAAPDKATLREARRCISLRTEPLTPVLDPLLSEQQFAAYQIGRGDVDEALRTASLVIEGEYRVGHQEQLYIENQAMIAVPRPDGGITITGSMQCPYYVHDALKRALALTDEQAVITQAETGGGFGGKEEYPSVVAIHAALLAQRVGKPVRMIYDRHEDIAATTKRHPAVVRHRTGVDADGNLVAQDVEVVMDGGAYCTLTPVVLSRGILHAGGPYHCPNTRIRGRAMATNTPPNGAFRGFGAPQVEFAAELQAARVADALGVSPAQLRERWMYRQGDITPTGQLLRESVGSAEVLERATEAAEYERIRELSVQTRAVRWGQAAEAGRGIHSVRVHSVSGIGLAMAWHGAGFTGRGEVLLASVAGIELGDDGVVRVLIANTEIGQGTKTIFPMLAAEALGIEPEAVEMAPVDTSVVPNSGPTVASRTAMVVGGLIVKAAERLRATVEARSGAPFAETYQADARTHGATRIDEQFEPYPDIEFDEATYTGDAYPVFGWACAVAQIDVDLDTGEVHVRSVVSADDVGRVIHPILAEGQVEGGTLQAVGYATIEEMKVQDGRYLNDRLATYLIPTSLDAPRITAILVEKPFSGVPHGAKGVGELPMDVVAPAVIDAIHDAVGVWITQLPATPERILAALGAPGASGAGAAA